MASIPVTPNPSKVQTILAILQTVLNGIAVVEPGTAIAGTLLELYQNAAKLYQAEAGMPFDVTKIPFETPVQ